MHGKINFKKAYRDDNVKLCVSPLYTICDSLVGTILDFNIKIIRKTPMI